MSDKPWRQWIPGVLSKDQMDILCKEGYIKGVTDRQNAIDHSSIDLCLTDECWRMLRGSVKPSSDGRYRTSVLDNRMMAERNVSIRMRQISLPVKPLLRPDPAC